MGNKINKINFEDIQFIIKNSNNDINNYNSNYIIINVLKNNEQDCLIMNTIPFDKEELIINYYLKHNKYINIIIYGKNSNDDNTINKYKQLLHLGFYNLFIYTGGLFEWLLLQDIYSDDLFPTNNKCYDILKYKAVSLIDNKLLTY
jgi:hypothetical protein